MRSNDENLGLAQVMCNIPIFEIEQQSCTVQYNVYSISQSMYNLTL